MVKFINYTPNQGLKINNYRAPRAAATDLRDIAEAITQERAEDLTCSLEGNELAVLEDGQYWQGSNVSQHALDELHALISENS